MARDLNFGVVGLGMGGHHCIAVKKAKGANLVAVCDLDEERLARATKTHGVRGYTKYAEMLKDKSIDCVNVVVESGKHAELGIAAARAGKHIIMEKPVDITPARIKKFQDAVRPTGVKVGCIFQSRFDNCNILLKRAIDKGKLGKLIGAHAHLPWFRADSYYAGPHGSWKGTWKLDGGGSLMNQGIHTVDLLQWLAGPVHSVCGFYGVFDHAIEAEDQTVGILKFENGAFGTLFSTTCCVPEGAQRVFFYGTKGSFSAHAGKLEFYEAGPPKERRRMMGLFGGARQADAAAADPMAVSADGHTLIIEDLVKAIRYDREPAITVESAKHAVEIACAIYRSAPIGKEVKISQVRK
ncbi:MAG TPA: Gfo/Idh/MocA family oxidoreductase [Candidatus Hydrogenedentes bacterium]|nr:Gfo/Idh/MocA family oxidoreductase [Candidatus Hydrogenedentota bacterium]